MDIPTNLELTGMWFFPDAPEKKYLGILEYKPFEETHTLTLYGIVFPVEEKIACINGETTDGKKVSLFDSSVNNGKSGNSNALSAHTVFSFLNFLIGDSFFSSKDEVKFQYLSFRCSNLAEWLGVFPFQPILQPKKKGLFFEKKQSVAFFSDEKVCIQLQFLMSYSFSCYEGTMKYCPTIVIKAKSNKTIPYWGEEKSLSYYKQVVDSFLDLVIGRKAFSYNIIGLVRNRNRFPSNVLQHNNKRKIYLDIKEFPPAPRPFPNPTIIINNGVIYPSAASGSAPSPATHMLSIMLFANIKNILAIIGKDSLFIAFFGSPVIISMFLFFSIIFPFH